MRGHRIAATATTWAHWLRQRAGRLRDDRGVTTVETLMWAAIAAGIVAAVGLILRQIFIDKANSVSL